MNGDGGGWVTKSYSFLKKHTECTSPSHPSPPPPHTHTRSQIQFWPQCYASGRGVSKNLILVGTIIIFQHHRMEHQPFADDSQLRQSSHPSVTDQTLLSFHGCVCCRVSMHVYYIWPWRVRGKKWSEARRICFICRPACVCKYHPSQFDKGSL